MSYVTFNIVVNVQHRDNIYESSPSVVVVKLSKSPEVLNKVKDQLQNIDFRSNVAQHLGNLIEEDCLKVLRNNEPQIENKNILVSFRLQEESVKGLSKEEAQGTNHSYFVVLSGPKFYGDRGNVPFELSLDNKVFRETLFD